MQNRQEETDTNLGLEADEKQGGHIHPDAEENPLATAEAGIIGLIIAGVTITAIVYLVVLRLWL
jgi:hypothetical protein